MAKLKPPWVKTDIPKTAKVKLWRLMKDNQTFDAFQGQVAKNYDEIFVGVSKKAYKYSLISRDTYKKLQDELMHMPVEEVLSLPDDLQLWIRGLRVELPTKEQEERVLNVTPEHRDHWHRLGKIAEELKIGLEFNRGSEGNVVESRFGGTVWGHWYFDSRKDPEVSFSAQSKKLWGCFLSHMDAEFDIFSDEIRKFQYMASRLVKENLDTEWGDDLHPVRSAQATQILIQKLWQVIERGTFMGTCEICEDRG